MAEQSRKFHLRRKDREITDRTRIEDVMRKATVVHLGMVDGDEAYVVPVNFGYEENCLYFHSAAKGHKIDLLKKNNRVCFEIDGDVKIESSEKSRCNVKYRSVIGRGTAHILEDQDEKIRGIKTIMRQCDGSEFEFPQDSLKSVLVFRIDIENLSGKQAGY
jgi:hypothetical protein